MPRIEDLWVRKDRTRKPRYGQGRRWRVTWEQPDGSRATATFKTKDAAQAKATAVDHTIRSGEYVPKAQATQTVGDYWPRFETIKSTTSRKTKLMYSGAWDNYVQPRWENTPVRAVHAPAVQEWLAGLTSTRGQVLSGSAVSKVRRTLSGILDLAVADRVLQRNPLDRVKTKGDSEKPRRYLTTGQVRNLAAAFRPHHLEIWTLVFTGIRKGELWGIRGSDIDEARGVVRIARDLDQYGHEDATKNRGHRDVPVPPVLLRDLRKAATRSGAGGYVFPGPLGTRWTDSLWRRRWDRARPASGYLDFDTHELRHTAASMAITAGADVKVVQRMLGHASASTTLDIYGHLFEDRLGDVSRRMQGLFGL